MSQDSLPIESDVASGQHEYPAPPYTDSASDMLILHLESSFG